MRDHITERILFGLLSKKAKMVVKCAIGLYVLHKQDDEITGAGARVNLLELKVGFEFSEAVQWDDMTQSTYTNVSVNGWTIAMVVLLFTVGQYQPSATSAYAY